MATIDVDPKSKNMVFRNEGGGGMDVRIAKVFAVRSDASRADTAFAFSANASTGVATAGMAYAIHGCETRIESRADGRGMDVTSTSRNRPASVSVHGTLDAHTLSERGVSVSEMIIDAVGTGVDARRMDALETAVDAMDVRMHDIGLKMDAMTLEMSRSVDAIHERIDKLFDLYSSFTPTLSNSNSEDPNDYIITSYVIPQTESSIRTCVEEHVGIAAMEFDRRVEAMVDDILTKDRASLVHDVRVFIADTMAKWTETCQSAAKTCKDAVAVASAARALTSSTATSTSSTSSFVNNDNRVRQLVSMEMEKHKPPPLLVVARGDVKDGTKQYFPVDGDADRSNAFVRCIEHGSDTSRLEFIDQLYYPPYAIHPPMVQSPLASGLGICSSHAKGQVIVYAGQKAGLPIERMRITAGGDIGVGTLTPKCVFDVNGRLNAKEVFEDDRPLADTYIKRTEVTNIYVKRTDLDAVEGRLLSTINALTNAFRQIQKPSSTSLMRRM
jgi:hypothetical protein